MHSYPLEPMPELPVHVDSAKEQMRVRHADDDVFIAELISKAGEHVESITRRSLIARKRRLVTAGFSPCIELPHPPIVSVESVSYRDSSGALETIPADTWRVSEGWKPLLMRRIGAGPWPTTSGEPDAVIIDYTAGYGTRWEQVPAPLRHAIVLLAAHWYENREAVVVGQTPPHTLPLAFDQLLVPYSTWRVG